MKNHFFYVVFFNKRKLKNLMLAMNITALFLIALSLNLKASENLQQIARRHCSG
jgi:hypothetical protein